MRNNKTPPHKEARVVQLFQAKKLTAAEIARECDVSRRTVFRIARRNVTPPQPTAGAV